MKRNRKHNDNHKKFSVSDQKANFFKRLESFCEKVGGPGTYELLPKAEKQRLFWERCLPVKVQPAPGESIPENALKRIRRILPIYLKETKLRIEDSGIEISLNEIFSTGLSLLFYSNDLGEKAFAGANELKRRLQPLLLTERLDREINSAIGTLITILGLYVGNLKGHLYSVDFSPLLQKYGISRIEIRLVIHSHVPERQRIEIDGSSRPIVRVGCVISVAEGPQYIQLTVEQLKLPEQESGKKFDVYAQTHALDRLRERLEFWSDETLSFNLFLSLHDAIIHKQSESSFLIDYRVGENKLGYLAAEIIDGLVVIRTFLFLTHAGTPEGEKLRKICGFQKLDIQYLAIDKLSTFVNADIRSDRKLEALFMEAGCGSLLDIKGPESNRTDDAGDMALLPLLQKFLGTGKQKEFLTPESWKGSDTASVT